MEGRKKLHWGLKTHGLSFVFILLPPPRESLRLTLQLWMRSVTDDSKGQDPGEEQEVKTAGLSAFPVAAGTPKEKKSRLGHWCVQWLWAHLRTQEVQRGHPAVVARLAPAAVRDKQM